MEVRSRTLFRLANHHKAGFQVTAAGPGQAEPSQPPWQKGGGLAMPPEAQGAGTGMKRAIPSDHPFDAKAIKPLVKTLWAMSVSLGHALTAHRQFARLKSSSFSPDGMLGGRGYVLPIKDVRAMLYEACENLSALCDTIHDEVNGPHWKPKLAELEKMDFEEVEKLLGDAEDWIDNPEEEVEEEMEEVEKDKKPKSWSSERFDDKDKETSQLPGASGKETIEEQGPHPASPKHPGNRKQASSYSYDRVANSSIAPQTEPGGPRVQHLDRADSDQDGPGGSYNRDEQPVADQWGETGGVSGEPMSQNTGDSYAYGETGSAGGGRSGLPVGSSGMPDANTDGTKTQGYDFGIGDGNGNDAHGQGAGGYGAGNPSSGGRGVYGPKAELPDDPGGKTKDTESDSTPVVEGETSGRLGLTASHVLKVKAMLDQKLPLRDILGSYLGKRFKLTAVDLAHIQAGQPFDAATVLPNDTDEPVARSDYYADPKGNDFNGKIHGSDPAMIKEGPGQPVTVPGPESAPIKPIPSEYLATSDLPGQPPEMNEGNRDLSPNLTERVEPADQPYVKYNDTTHEMRPDYNYQRGPFTAPYVKQ